MNEATLFETASFTRGAEHCHCGLCGGGYDKWVYLYAKVTTGPLQGAVVCPDCLAAIGRGEVADLLRGMAARHEEAAEYHRSIADAARQSIGLEFRAPSFATWNRRNRRADREYVAAQGGTV